MTDSLDPSLAAVLEQLRAMSREDWRVALAGDFHVLHRGDQQILFGLREDVLNYMLAYMGGIQAAWRDFTARCPATGSA